MLSAARAARLGSPQLCIKAVPGAQVCMTPLLGDAPAVEDKNCVSVHD